VDSIVDVRGPDGTYLLRAEPWNKPHLVGSLILAWLERKSEKNEEWVIRVRRYQDDPFGRVLYEERVRSKEEVPAAVERVQREIRQHGIPPAPSPDGTP